MELSSKAAASCRHRKGATGSSARWWSGIAQLHPREGAHEHHLRELQRSRGGRMRDIVETIWRDQVELVTGSPSDILFVQGGF
ncbi:hypothetical protein [Streptomyces sp. ADI95-16]|uniref:hypothetical protein n=1 Tax=Streptomyces sp. ADI95-16 TaxID=1522758 RepID=UPI0013DE39FF|nr:hypothetical protein [Streptomyces sp. ADI95-16]